MKPFLSSFMPSALKRARCLRAEAGGMRGLMRPSDAVIRCHGKVADSAFVRLLNTEATCSATTFICTAKDP